MSHTILDPDLPKADLRSAARRLREQTNSILLSPRIVAGLYAVPELHTAQNVLLYLAMPGEINVEALADNDRKQWYAPRCLPARAMGVYRYVAGETPLTTSRKGLRQPDPNLCIAYPPDVLDAVIVPGLFFTTDGDRLGQGGGYYDRFLPLLRANCVRIGVAPDACVLSALPRDDWDAIMDIVVTETRVVRTHRRTQTAVHPARATSRATAGQ